MSRRCSSPHIRTSPDLIPRCSLSATHLKTTQQVIQLQTHCSKTRPQSCPDLRFQTSGSNSWVEVTNLLMYPSNKSRQLSVSKSVFTGFRYTLKKVCVLIQVQQVYIIPETNMFQHVCIAVWIRLASGQRHVFKKDSNCC